MNGFLYTIAVVCIFTVGAITGFAVHERLNDYIDQEVANRIDDQKVLQQAGYIPQFVDSEEFAVIGR